ncbi:MAG: tetratricopeptide repeat protein [Chitinophagales bacterium]|nr:tetratricopeptide repeat protein [Chitinophagales bacterium]
MQKVYLIVLALWFTGSCLGQSLPDRDSLLSIWNDSTKEDTLRLEALFQMINNHYSSKLPDSARILSQLLYEKALEADAVRYQVKASYLVGNAFMHLGQYEASKAKLEEALLLSEQLGDHKWMALTLNSLSIVNQDLGDLDLALEQLQKSMDINYQAGDTARTTGNLLNIAAIYESKGETLNSLEYNKKALSLCRRYNKQRHLAIAHNNIANNYKFLGDIPKSTEHYLGALAIYDGEDNALGKSSTLNNLAVLLLNNKNYEEANGYLQEALTIANDANIYPYQVITYANLGSLKAAQGQTELAMLDLQNGLNVVEQHGLGDMKPYLQLEMGRVLKDMKRFDEAEVYIYKGLTGSKKGGRTEDALKGYMNLSTLLIQKEKWAEAKVYATEGLALAEKTKNLSYSADLSSILVDINKHFGNTAEALRLHEKYVSLRDSIYNEESMRSLLKQEYKYDYTKRAYQDSIDNAAAMELQGADLNRRKTINLFLWGILALVIVFVFILYNRFQLIQQQKKAIQEEKEKAEMANAKLLEIDQSKSRFFTNISHEFRTPLAVISGMVEQIKDPEHGQVKRLVRRNIDHLLHLINQILDLRKLESGSLPVHYVQSDVVKYLRYILESFHSLAETKNITLSFQTNEQSLVLDYDSEKLLRIVSNLLSNAIKFTPEQGAISLSLDALSSPEMKHYQFAVIDNGMGISQEKLPYVFDRFYQIDDSISRVGEGTGIGLTLTKELVTLLRGEINVKSQEGKGTTFIVQLPFTQQAPMEDVKAIIGEKTSIIPESLSNTTTQEISILNQSALPRLLIVEDNPDVMEYLITCLGDAYQLLFAYDGQEGLDNAIKEIPDLIISDVMMPRMDGFTMCNRLKNDERTSHIPLILLTAKADMESKITGLQRGADAYLVKPFDQRELTAQLNNLFHLRQQLQKRYGSLEDLVPSDNVVLQQEDAFILKLKDVFMGHIDDLDYSLDALSKAMHLSRSQLGRKVKALTGKSLALYIRSIRLAEAKKLLITTDSPIKEIAYDVGFATPTYFTNSYVNEFNETPSETRVSGLLRK